MNQTEPLTVDVSNLVDGGLDDLHQVAESVARACDRSGFFYIENHGISATDFQKILQTSRSFFDLNEREKNTIAIDTNNRGYLGFGEAKMYGARRTDLKEVFFFGREIADNDPDWLARLPLIGPNQWPLRPLDFKSTVLEYLTAVQLVGDGLLRAFALTLGKDYRFFESRYQRPMSRGQLIHYPPLPNDAPEDQYSVAAHSDFGCITMLLQELPGLEVLTKNNDWISVPPKPGTLVVNIGDLLERWTNGHLTSTKHRVRNLGNKHRYSVAIFHDPGSGAIIDPKELSTAPGSIEKSTPKGEQDSDYKAISAGEYILGRSEGVFAQFKP